MRGESREWQRKRKRINHARWKEMRAVDWKSPLGQVPKPQICSPRIMLVYCRSGVVCCSTPQVRGLHDFQETPIFIFIEHIKLAAANDMGDKKKSYPIMYFQPSFCCLLVYRERRYLSVQCRGAFSGTSNSILPGSALILGSKQNLQRIETRAHRGVVKPLNNCLHCDSTAQVSVLQNESVLRSARHHEICKIPFLNLS